MFILCVCFVDSGGCWVLFWCEVMVCIWLGCGLPWLVWVVVMLSSVYALSGFGFLL